MKLICDRGALVEALALTQGVVVARTPKPVLTCVKLSADGGVVTLAATDLEVAIHLAVDQVEVQEPGEALVSADKLAAIVRESTDPTLTIHTDGDQTHVTGADSHYRIFGYPVAEFPPVEPFTGDGDYEIGAGNFVDLITKTLFATARENSRYAINGVLVEREGKKLTMVATDGRRLALARGSVSGTGGAGQNIIVPTKALHLLERLLDDPAESVKVKLADNQVHFATESATLTSNLVDGNFPPYQDVIPKEQDRKATFATDALASGVRRTALLTNEESKGVKMAFSSEQLVLSSRAPEMGEAQVNVPVEAFDGEPIEIGFNPQFVTDVLKVVDSDQVTIEMKAPNKPGTLKAGSDFTYVVMPISLG
jgi:DNA polymerase-3 subunit beta